MRRRLGPILLIVLGGLLLAITLGYWRFSAAIASPEPAPLPQSLAGLPLTTATYGSQAVAEVTRLHKLAVPLSSGAVGMYGNRGQAVLWVSGTPVQPMAVRMVADMRDRIAEGNSPFTPRAERVEGKRTVYELDGMGQKHFYFRSASLVIWLAADPDIAEQALQETLVFYP